MENLVLRKADRADVDLLFKWANDPTVRNNSFRTNKITYEEHVNWFNNILRDSNTIQCILMKGDAPIGQIRLGIIGDRAEIGYSIAKEYRGNGYGHSIIQLVAEYVSINHPEINSLVAKVKPDNSASNRLFQSEGYKLEYLYYEKDLLPR